MYDPVTLDQLRAFATVVEEGSFSAAARRLSRVQSAISTSMANLEQQLGVTLWDRSTKVAKLTDEGRAVLAAARRVLAEVDGLRQLTRGMVEGLEPKVSLCIDALFPLDALIDVTTAFAREFPSVDLRVDTQVLSAVSAEVLAGAATLGVVGTLALVPALERQMLGSVQMVPVVAPAHRLARYEGVIPERALADAIQVVLSERRTDGVPDQAVLSSRTWRVADLHTKHMMLRAGLGWGNLPDHLTTPDVATKRLVIIRPTSWAAANGSLTFYAVHKSNTVFGPAHRWLLAQLALRCRASTAPVDGVKAPPKTAKRRRS